MQAQYAFSNLLQTVNDLLQLWDLKPVLYRILFLVVIIVASILLLHLASVALLAGGCNPNCAPLI